MDLEGRYDSLAGVGFDEGEGTAGDFILRVRPGLSMEIPGSSGVFSLDAKADWNRYSGIDRPGTKDLSYVGGDGHLSFHVRPESKFSLKLGDRFSHSDRTSAVGLGVGVLSLFNELYVSAPVRPGGGAFTFTPGYSFALESFLSASTVFEGSGEVNRLNYFSHRPTLEMSWRFLPKTAVVLDADADIRRYPDREINVPLNALRAHLGLAGLVTPRLSVTARGGYGNTFIPSESLGEGVADYASFIGQLEGTYELSQTARLQGGLLRTFFPVPRFGWYADNRLYGNARLLMAGRLLVEAEGAVHLLGYAGGRTDLLVEPSLTARYRVTRWLNFGAGYRYSRRWAGEENQGPFGNYQRNELFGSIVMSY